MAQNKIQFLFMLLVVLSGFVVSKTKGEDCIKTIFNFGDDLSDTGNYVIQNPRFDGPAPPPLPNITWDDLRSQETGEGVNTKALLRGFPPINRTFGDVHNLPYGTTHFKKPSGRFSNGRLIIDFMADVVGLPFLPPYLAGLKAEDYKKGANFAVIRATVLDHFQVSDTSSKHQLNWLKDLLPRLCSNVTRKECEEFLGSSLFHLGGIGGYYYGLDKNSKQLHDMVPLVVYTIISTVNELVSLGARRLMVAGLLPIGCFPRVGNNYPKEHMDDERACVYEFNSVARHHNTLLQTSLQQLRETYPHVNIMYVDYYTAMIHLIDSRIELGFSKKEGVSIACGRAKSLDLFYYALFSESCEEDKVCENPEKYILWDQSHMSEAAYKYIASSVIVGNITTPSFDMASTKCSP